MGCQPNFATRGSAQLLLPTEDREYRGRRPILGFAPFASLAASVLGPSAAPPPVKEKRTGTIFPGELEYCAGKVGCPVVTGVGARNKRIAGIKGLDLYALALFVDPGSVRSALRAKFGSADAAALARDQRLFDELVAAEGVEKTLRIVVTSGLVKRGAFLEALEERLAPPLQAAGELAALAAFRAQFDAASFRKGLEITFVAAGGRLTTKIDGKQAGTIASRGLAHSLLGIYLGGDPVSRGAKESIGRGLASMVLG